MRLIIVRHGETEHNATGIVMGHARVPLNARGRTQARLVANRLRSEPIDIIYSSDLPRAAETAQIIAQRHPAVRLVETDRVRERSMGEYEGQHRSVLAAATKQATTPATDWRPASGESVRDLKQRAVAWLNQALIDHPRATVLLVSHGGFIYLLLEHIFHGEEIADHPELKHDNTGMTVVEIDSSGRGKLVTLNDISHLPEANSTLGPDMI